MPKWSYTFLQEVCSVVVTNVIAILGFFSKLTYIRLLLILLTSIFITIFPEKIIQSLILISYYLKSTSKIIVIINFIRNEQVNSFNCGLFALFLPPSLPGPMFIELHRMPRQHL